MKQYVKFLFSPLNLSAVLLFGVAFNLNLPDLGETYVSRNLFGWVVIFLLIVHLWWRPLNQGKILWSPLWLIGLAVPVVGFISVLAINIVAGYAHYHPGHYLFAPMLLAFALLIGGLLQYEWTEKAKFNFIFISIVCFMPQYLIHLVTGNEFVFALLPVDEIVIHNLLYKPFAGFGQYNVFGSAYATLLTMACTAFVFAPIAPKLRLAFLLPIALLAIDLPFSKSSTALLGLFSGLGFLAAHILITARERLYISRYLTFVGMLGVISLIIIVALAFTEQTDRINELSARRASFSFNTRLTMWLVGFWGFLDQPILGNGLGSYLSVYMAQFAENGVEKGLVFFPNVTVPHNIIIHVLAETGLFGLAFILGPFIFLAVKILQLAGNRLLVLAFLAPILVHAQLEYPYIASGTHYWLFAIALVFALGGQLMPQREYIIPAEKPALSGAAFGAICLSAGIGIYTAISLAMAASQAAHIYNDTRKLPLNEFLANRFTMPDIAHPIMGKRINAIAHLVIVQKAIADRRADVLRDVSVPALETHVLPYYPTAAVWETTLKIYITLRDRDKAMQLVSYIRKFQPENAARYEAFVRQALPLQPPNRLQ